MKLKNILSTSSLILISSAVYAQYDTVVMCRACPAGYVGNGSGTECTACAAGTYQPSAGQSSCISITDGKNCATGSANTSYTSCVNKAGRTKCDPKTCKATSCSAGYYLSNGECVLCEAGYRCPGDNKKYDCTPGTYQPLKGKSSCDACPVGAYSSGYRATSCSTCAATVYGSWSGECGSVSRSYTAYCTSTGSTSSTDKSYKGTENKDIGGCPGDLKCNYNHRCACEDKFVGNGGSIERQGTSCVTVCPTPYTPCLTSCIISSCDHETSKTCKYKDDNGKTQKKTLTRSCTLVAPYGWTACSRQCNCDPWPSCP